MPNTQEKIANPHRSPLARAGCIIALIIWFTVLLAPCFMIALAIRGEISLTTGSAPEQRIRVWLIQEADQTGIGISNAGVQEIEDNICVQTDVNFVLWRGEAQPVQYCECYVQTADEFQAVSVTQAACSP